MGSEDKQTSDGGVYVKPARMQYARNAGWQLASPQAARGGKQLACQERSLRRLYDFNTFPCVTETLHSLFSWA